MKTAGFFQGILQAILTMMDGLFRGTLHPAHCRAQQNFS
jgi:hypothetical protein